MSGRFLLRAVVAAGILLAGSTAVAQPLIQVGSGGESRDAREGWVLGAGYNFELPLLPFEVGGLVQGGTGIQTGEDSREYPLRAFVTGRVGMLPLPGFSVYIGGGAGVATRLGGEAESATAPAGMAFGGFEVGRLHLEVQFQREFHEEPVNRWVTTIGVTF
ncbi:MAG: hypothetical protein OXE58_01610 [Acidobacteria bacterium]|nr:hypothetical protein [Acidobacteriota bacterium]